MENTIKEVQDLLSTNKEWISRYDSYAKELLKKADLIKNKRCRIKESPPFCYYISTSEIKKTTNRRLLLDVRYRGQSVATLRFTPDNVILSTDKEATNKNNKRDFYCNIELKDADWIKEEARKFRKFFKDRPNSRNCTERNKGNEEHNVESLLLTEFSKRNSEDKHILGIQPVKFSGIRLGIPTPLKASKPEKVEYANSNGGGIDILVRTGRGSATYLTVIEVKDENNLKEPPKSALRQALAYAVFIRELLRSKSGDDWYKILGFKGNVPSRLKFRIACGMPDDYLDKSFAKQIHKIDNDEIECHYIYFKYDGKELSDFQHSFY